MTHAEQMYTWIIARLNEGRTVYAASYGHVIKIQAKHKASVRLSAGKQHCEVQRGTRWDSINFCKITAR